MLHEPARLAHRNIKNVSDDVTYLAPVGLVDLRKAEKKVSARVNDDKILRAFFSPSSTNPWIS